MIGRWLTFGALAASAWAVPLAPAHAEFFSYEQMRTMCRGEGEGAEPQFRTSAGRALLAESYRGRCRMYLLGQADALLQSQPQRLESETCMVAQATDSEVAEAIVEALLARTEAPAGGIAEVVRDVLRARFACS